MHSHVPRSVASSGPAGRGPSLRLQDSKAAQLTWTHSEPLNCRTVR